jgi:DNA-binding CsgD family transcriptional regulator
MPAQEAASLLAMQCVMHGQAPQDFRVMVPIGGDLPNGLGPLTRRLIEACMSMHSDVLLSQRQHEVLRLVLEDLSNKEIAGELHIGVRTAKFHVSALLEKFGVANRAHLAKKTRELMSAATLPAKPTFLQPATQKALGKPQVRNSRESPLRLRISQKQASE